jgi:Mrp family chromosome partitioning ATPase/uncharacterized protein involved in exopolysaccharide biosynthesis
MHGDGAWPVLEAAAAPSETRQSLWATIDDRLRGRWRWVCLAGLLLGAGLALAGWRSTVPMYQSTGVIRVSPRVPVTLEAIPEVELQKFSMFANTQVQLIRSRRVLENAREDRDLKALEWTSAPDVLERLDAGLDVYTGGDSELIYVAFEAETPQVAQAVVNAVIRSYYDIYGMAGGTLVGATLRKLRGVEAQFLRELNQVRSEAARLQHRYGTLELMELQASTQERRSRLQDLVEAAQAALARLPAGDPGVLPGPGAAAEINPGILEHLERIDPRLADLRAQRDRARLTFDTTRQRYRSGTAAYRRAESALQILDQLHQEEYLEALDLWEQLPDVAGPALDERSFAGLTPARLREKTASMQARLEEMDRTLTELAADVQRAGDLKVQQERIQGDLNRTRDRIQGLELEEQNIAGRVVVEQEGFRPESPSADRRVKRAALGLAGGCGLSFALFFFWGTLDRRAYGARQLAQAEAGLPEVLGVLPDLRGGALDGESSEVASHCVHQIRNQIEAVREQRGGYVLVITSPFQGDGKTSIGLALGWSYDIAGHRTLLLDCDLVGRSLSRQLGLLDQPGLKEALRRGDATGLVRPLRSEGLCVLPVGCDRRFGPEAVRTSDLRALLDSLRDRFDMIIVDTGPLLGSLESTPATASADGVVLSVRRGRARSRLQDCVARLRSVGANCLGMVLNCAARSDCNRYVSEASLSASLDARGRGAAAGPGGGRPVAPLDDDRNALMLAMEMTARREESET